MRFIKAAEGNLCSPVHVFLYCDQSAVKKAAKLSYLDVYHFFQQSIAHEPLNFLQPPPENTKAKATGRVFMTSIPYPSPGDLNKPAKMSCTYL